MSDPTDPGQPEQNDLDDTNMSCFVHWDPRNQTLLEDVGEQIVFGPIPAAASWNGVYTTSAITFVIWRKLSYRVQMEIPQATGTLISGATIGLPNAQPIPANMRPMVNTYIPCLLLDNNTAIVPGYAVITASTGVIQFKVSPTYNSGAFTSSSTVGLPAQTIAWDAPV